MREEIAATEAHRAKLALGHFHRTPNGDWVESAAHVYDGEGRAVAGPQSAYAPDPKRPVHTPGHCGCGAVHE
jgi:hypothetical protein